MERNQFGTDEGSRPLTRERLSELIGLVYDCALAPTLWPKAIGAIGDAANCFAGVIAVTDLETSKNRLAETWNYDTYWLSRQPEYADEVAQLWKKFLAREPLLDEPASTRRELPESYETRYYNEWARPQGIVDSLHLVVLRKPNRVGEFALSRHERFGFITDEDIATVRLLAPHIRRAVTIGDVLDTKSLESRTFGATLDGIAVGVVIVAEEGRIMHANDAARRMLDVASPITSSRGCLAALNPQVTRELLGAISLARADEAQIGHAGIGVPLLHADMTAATAHVLPLARGDLRTRLVPNATAGVFIVPDGTSLPAEIGTVARVFGLTPAETRQLEQLMAGATLSEAAAALRVSVATARTHREHIFTKMGVSRRGDLVSLVRRLIPPIRRPNVR
jgi:DNA-binding CsgD family transcriptional regulator